MLHGQSHLRQLAIIIALGVGQRMKLAALLQCPGMRMLVLNTLISSVGEEFGVGMDGSLRLLRESKIMRRPATRGNAEDLSGDEMNQELQFKRVALLFSAVTVPLLFWGVHRAPR